MNGKINAEIQEQAQINNGLERQANSNAEAILQTGLNILDADQRRKSDLLHEERERIEHYADLHTQVDRASAAGIENSLALSEALAKRRESLALETKSRVHENIILRNELDTASGAILQNVVNIAEEAQKRRELSKRLIQEVHDEENVRYKIF